MGIKINGMSDFVTAFHSQIIERLHHVKPAGFGSMTKYSAISRKSSLLKYRWFKQIFFPPLETNMKTRQTWEIPTGSTSTHIGFRVSENFWDPKTRKQKRYDSKKRGHLRCHRWYKDHGMRTLNVMLYRERELIWKEVSTTKYLIDLQRNHPNNLYDHFV